MLKKLKRISTEELSSNPWWSYRHDRYLKPDDAEGDYFYIQTPGSVAVVPELPNGKLLLLKQYRYLNQRECIEFPGGGASSSQSAESAARRELLEEAGLVAGELTEIGSFNPMNGATDEMCSVFVARGIERATARPESTEEFELIELTLEELSQFVADGIIWDGMTLAVLSLYLLRFKHSLH